MRIALDSSVHISALICDTGDLEPHLGCNGIVWSREASLLSQQQTGCSQSLHILVHPFIVSTQALRERFDRSDRLIVT